MMRKYEFVDKTIHIVRERLEKGLPEEDTLEEMILKAKELLKDILR
jgi:hypothetical protein